MKHQLTSWTIYWTFSFHWVVLASFIILHRITPSEFTYEHLAYIWLIDWLIVVLKPFLRLTVPKSQTNSLWRRKCATDEFAASSLLPVYLSFVHSCIWYIFAFVDWINVLWSGEFYYVKIKSKIFIYCNSSTLPHVYKYLCRHILKELFCIDRSNYTFYEALKMAFSTIVVLSLKQVIHVQKQLRDFIR